MQNNQTEIKDLPHQRDSKSKCLFTPTEAKELGIPWKSAPPPAKRCEFCGAILESEGIYLMGVIVMWRPEYLPVRCSCKQAQRYWADYERKQAEKEAQEEKEKRKQQYIDKIKKLTADSGIKKRFLQRQFKNFRCDTAERRKCFDIALEYADNFDSHKEKGEGLFFEGTNGTGKTHLAAAIAIRLIARGIPVIFKTFDDILTDIKRAYDTEGINEYEVKNVYKNVDLLIIDDLGKEKCTEWSMTILYSILNYRYESMLPVIITTNYNADGLTRAMIPDGLDHTSIMSTISRLKEVSTVVTMAWEDIRISKQRG